MIHIYHIKIFLQLLCIYMIFLMNLMFIHSFGSVSKILGIDLQFELKIQKNTIIDI